MDAETVHELSAAYALDALEPEEREVFEEHLTTCASCREDVVELVSAASELAWAVEPASPPPALRDRILEAARAERPRTGYLQHLPLRPRRTRAWLGAAAAVAACAVLALGIWNVSLHNQLSDARSSALERLPVAGLDGSVVVGSGGSAALVAFRLPAAPAGKTYEAWIVRGKNAAPAGVFRGGSRATFVPIDGKVRKGTRVAVTVEPAGGSEQPTTTPFAVSAPV
jgi:anti-sigma-K factor RskA